MRRQTGVSYVNIIKTLFVVVKYKVYQTSKFENDYRNAVAVRPQCGVLRGSGAKLKNENALFIGIKCKICQGNNSTVAIKMMLIIALNPWVGFNNKLELHIMQISFKRPLLELNRRFYQAHKLESGYSNFVAVRASMWGADGK